MTLKGWYAFNNGYLRCGRINFRVFDSPENISKDERITDPLCNTICDIETALRIYGDYDILAFGCENTGLGGIARIWIGIKAPEEGS